jgi:dTDP-4-dehydrorhamnose reductase
MPTFILLSTLTQQGVQTLKSNPERLRQVNQDVEELGCRVLPVRAADADEICTAIAAERPTWIVDCGPTSNSSWDFGEFDAAHAAELVTLIITTAKSCGSRFTFVSTDAIFQGPKLFHRETSEIGDGARSVAAARVEKALAGVAALIIRTHLFGWSPTGASSAEHLWQAIESGKPIPACGNQYASPLLATDFAELLWLANRKRLCGTYHLAGAERISQWQFAMLMALVGWGALVRYVARTSPSRSVNSTRRKTYARSASMRLSKRRRPTFAGDWPT